MYCIKFHQAPTFKSLNYICTEGVFFISANEFVGQNIATVQGDSPGLTPLALVDVWYMELLNINSSVISRFVP